MARMKEYLIEREYKLMERTQQFLLKIDVKHDRKPYKVAFLLMELNEAEPILHTIEYQVKISELSETIPKQVLKILHESNYSITGASHISWDALINKGWAEDEYLFEAYKYEDVITSFDDFAILPSNANAIVHLLAEINFNLSANGTELYEMRSEISMPLTEIVKGLDLSNYLKQG